MRIFICIKSVKLRYICPANQQFFCDDENPFFYGSIKKIISGTTWTYEVDDLPSRLWWLSSQKHNGIKSNLKLHQKYPSHAIISRSSTQRTFYQSIKFWKSNKIIAKSAAIVTTGNLRDLCGLKIRVVCQSKFDWSVDIVSI